MKLSLIAVATVAGCALPVVGLLAACASDEPGDAHDPDASSTILGQDAGPDAPDADVGDAANVAPCLPGTLCPSGLFDLEHPTSGVDLRTRITFLRGRSASDVWAAGAHGAVGHFDGTSWQRSDTGTIESVSSLWLRDSSEVGLLSLSSVLARGMTVPDAGAPSPGGWTATSTVVVAPEVNASAGQISSSWAAPGAEWLWCTTHEHPLSSTGGGSAINGLWRMHLGTTGEIEVDKALPAGACALADCRVLSSIHGASADDLWAVGYTGSAVHITNAQSSAPVAEAIDSQTWAGLEGVWVASANDVWAVGGAGTIRHYTGQPHMLDVVDGVPTTVNLRAVWGTSPSDIWAVGDAATVLHYDGQTWSIVEVSGLDQRRPDLYAVWTGAPGHVWAAGDGILLSIEGKP